MTCVTVPSRMCVGACFVVVALILEDPRTLDGDQLPSRFDQPRHQ